MSSLWLLSLQVSSVLSDQSRKPIATATLIETVLGSPSRTVFSVQIEPHQDIAFVATILVGLGISFDKNPFYPTDITWQQSWWENDNLLRAAQEDGALVPPSVLDCSRLARHPSHLSAG